MAEESPKKYLAFLSYNKEEAGEAVQEFQAKLEAYLEENNHGSGFEFFTDSGAPRNVAELEAIINDCDNFLFLLTESTWTTPYTILEAVVADSLGKRVFPIVLEHKTKPFKYEDLITYQCGYSTAPNTGPCIEVLEANSKTVQETERLLSGTLSNVMKGVNLITGSPRVVEAQYSDITRFMRIQKPQKKKGCIIM
mmetsp:Transcript_2874/g.3739  ORF Transcript_2874/g.3739 Transcript_2874/m.3739 type:complete len:195 (+) Transcript_2874:175-759(+)|eukprot:CAMPEP_0117777340 /NCGR_PEP_ID=MMETSP0948-20121206/326_1 /TAXON_ID=44440 /ORGANISM="Chattonella subsalsa, Strain CCMP2191" /LENGTH=194 /DNA_ID=CAMNT_0005604429 /DNA_START=175 /DNA_END=759 /DNA_ORIENTATION=+